MIKLIVGDWSDDGHCRKVDFIIGTEFSKKELKAAYETGAAKIGVDIVEEFRDHDSCKLSLDNLAKIEACGYRPSPKFERDIKLQKAAFEDIRVSPPLYFELYMHFVFVGNPLLTWHQITGADMPIGGYGLFD